MCMGNSFGITKVEIHGYANCSAELQPKLVINASKKI